jgi:uncharacterized protein (DUF3820 family)
MIRFSKGKYKGQSIVHCNDINYIRWYFKNVNVPTEEFLTLKRRAI